MKKLILLGVRIISFLGVAACSTNVTGNGYTTVTSSNSNGQLIVPPGMSTLDTNADFKTVAGAGGDGSSNYQVDQVKNMKITTSGSQRWLVIQNKNVNQVWPLMIKYLAYQGLVPQIQNQSAGIIQTQWATQNNTLSQHAAGVRSLFGMIGLANMYSMPSQFMFIVTIWQDGSNVNVFVTNYQMNEVYPNCKIPYNSRVETSDKQITRWMAIPPNPQIELNFLLQFMLFAGSDKAIVESIQKNINNPVATGSASVMATLSGDDTIILNDDFDRAWWRVGLVLERAGLGISDKERTTGEYDVYSLQSEFASPQQGLFSKLFGDGNGQSVKLPDAKYKVQVSTQGTQTKVTMKAINPDKNSQKQIEQYIQQMFNQLK